MQERITIKEYYKLKLLSIKTVIRQSFNVFWAINHLNSTGINTMGNTISSLENILR